MTPIGAKVYKIWGLQYDVQKVTDINRFSDRSSADFRIGSLKHHVHSRHQTDNPNIYNWLPDNFLRVFQRVQCIILQSYKYVPRCSPLGNRLLIYQDTNTRSISKISLTSVALSRCITPVQHVNELCSIYNKSTVPSLWLGEVSKVTGSEMRTYQLSISDVSQGSRGTSCVRNTWRAGWKPPNRHHNA